MEHKLQFGFAQGKSAYRLYFPALVAPWAVGTEKDLVGAVLPYEPGELRIFNESGGEGCVKKNIQAYEVFFDFIPLGLGSEMGEHHPEFRKSPVQRCEFRGIRPERHLEGDISAGMENYEHRIRYAGLPYGIQGNVVRREILVFRMHLYSAQAPGLYVGNYPAGIFRERMDGASAQYRRRVVFFRPSVDAVNLLRRGRHRQIKRQPYPCSGHALFKRRAGSFRESLDRALLFEGNNRIMCYLIWKIVRVEINYVHFATLNAKYRLTSKR